MTIELHPLCLAIPEMSEEEYRELRDNIAEAGLLEPVVTFEGMILDGRHRYRACIELGIDPKIQEFSGSDSAVDYVVSKNLRRRNLTTGQKAMAWEKLCTLQRGSNQFKPRVIEGGKEDREISLSTQSQATAAKSAGVDPTTIKQARKVSTRGAPELAQAVEQGKVSVSAAAKVVDTLPDHDAQREVLSQAKDSPRKIVEIAKQAKEKPKPREYITLSQWQKEKMTEVPAPTLKSQFNKQSDTAEDSMGNIEWAAWSWNPVTGCKHDCSYCYARDIAQRFYPQGFEPTLHPDRLAAPYQTRLPADAARDITKRNVFSNSMSDLYGRWVPQEWIDAVFKAMSDNPQWNFLTLTKFPKRAAELVYPENVWIGTSVDLQVRVKAAEEAFAKIECGVKWLSLEPLIEPVKFTRPELFSWVVIGGASRSSQTPEWTPPAEWIVRVASQFLEHGARIYLKTNGRPREFPGIITPENADDAFHYLSSEKKKTG